MSTKPSQKTTLTQSETAILLRIHRNTVRELMHQVPYEPIMREVFAESTQGLPLEYYKPLKSEFEEQIGELKRLRQVYLAEIAATETPSGAMYVQITERYEELAADLFNCFCELADIKARAEKLVENLSAHSRIKRLRKLASDLGYFDSLLLQIENTQNGNHSIADALACRTWLLISETTKLINAISQEDASNPLSGAARLDSYEAILRIEEVAAKLGAELHDMAGINLHITV